MHFTASQDQLGRALSQVTRFVQSQNSMPILGGIQLIATENTVQLQTTDLFSLITAEIPAMVSEPGYVVVPASTFSELIHRLPTATVDIEAESGTGKTLVKYGRSRATIHGFGTERLPEFPGIENTSVPVILPAGMLADLSRQILFACSKEDSRPILKGIHTELGAGKMVMVSTDGSRLSHAWVALPDYRGPEIKIILPAKVLLEGSRLSGGQQPISMSFAPGFVRLATDDVTLVSRLLDGEYPEYQRVIPQSYSVRIRIPLSELRGSMERAHLIASKDRSNSVRLAHQVGNLQISASAAEIGQALEELESDSQGQEMDVLFNSTFILDALKSMTGDDVTVELSGVQSPAKISDADNPQYFHIVLPLRQLV